MAEWISVKDELPLHGKEVLAAYHYKDSKTYFFGVLCYFGLSKEPHWRGEDEGLIVTHWMPIPKPPKEDNDD